MPYSVLLNVKRQLIEQTIRYLEQTTTASSTITLLGVETTVTPTAINELKKWIELPGVLTLEAKQLFCQKNGFPVDMATDSDFSNIIQNTLSMLNFQSTPPPSACPHVLGEAGLTGIHAFVVHSDHDGMYSKGQCVDILDWMTLVFPSVTHTPSKYTVQATPAQLHHGGDYYTTLIHDLHQLFLFAVQEQRCVCLT